MSLISAGSISLDSAFKFDFRGQSRMVWLLEQPWGLDAIWKMWWDYPLSSTFVFRVVWCGCWSNRGSGTPFGKSNPFMTDSCVQSPGRHLENLVGFSLYDQLLCSESDGVQEHPRILDAIEKM